MGEHVHLSNSHPVQNTQQSQQQPKQQVPSEQQQAAENYEAARNQEKFEEISLITNEVIMAPRKQPKFDINQYVVPKVKKRSVIIYDKPISRKLAIANVEELYNPMPKYNGKLQANKEILKLKLAEKNKGRFKKDSMYPDN
jgi:hypothetical protein